MLLLAADGDVLQGKQFFFGVSVHAHALRDIAARRPGDVLLANVQILRRGRILQIVESEDCQRRLSKRLALLCRHDIALGCATHTTLVRRLLHDLVTVLILTSWIVTLLNTFLRYFLSQWRLIFTFVASRI